tara:strand:+ start:4788 stop:5321 length:534 start_codon:yes stop_codon:yes gene_type:complete
MAINAAQVSNLGTIEQLRNEFNNLVTDVSGLEGGQLNFANIAATALSVGDLTITGSFEIASISPTSLAIQSDRMSFEGTGNDDPFETTFVVINPTVDRTITFKNADGIVAFTSDLGFTNSTLTEVPGLSGNFDLAQGESPFDAGATDAFGIAIGNLYDNNEPKGTTNSTELGSNTGI